MYYIAKLCINYIFSFLQSKRKAKGNSVFFFFFFFEITLLSWNKANLQPWLTLQIEVHASQGLWEC